MKYIYTLNKDIRQQQEVLYSCVVKQSLFKKNVGDFLVIKFNNQKVLCKVIKTIKNVIFIDIIGANNV